MLEETTTEMMDIIASVGAMTTTIAGTTIGAITATAAHAHLRQGQVVIRTIATRTNQMVTGLILTKTATAAMTTTTIATDHLARTKMTETDAVLHVTIIEILDLALDHLRHPLVMHIRAMIVDPSIEMTAMIGNRTCALMSVDHLHLVVHRHRQLLRPQQKSKRLEEKPSKTG